MKKIVFILVLILGFIGCSSDRNEDGPSVVGTWAMNSVTVKGTLSKNGQNTSLDQTQNADACSSKTTLVFKADKTGSGAAYQQDTAGNCKMTGSENFSYAYDPTTKVLTETVNGQSESVTLTALTSTTMSYGQSFKNVNFGQYDASLEGYYFTGTITSNFIKK